MGLTKIIRAGRKPSSVSLIAQGGDHLSGPPIARRHERSTRKSRTGRPYSRSRGRRFPMRSCSRRGFPSTPGRPGIWWALTPPFHPCPSSGRSSFLWHCPWGRPLSRFGTALPCGARTFLPPFPGSNHLTRSEYCKSEILSSKSEIMLHLFRV